MSPVLQREAITSLPLAKLGHRFINSTSQTPKVRKDMQKITQSNKASWILRYADQSVFGSSIINTYNQIPYSYPP